MKPSQRREILLSMDVPPGCSVPQRDPTLGT
jgi:hypothetical protein